MDTLNLHNTSLQLNKADITKLFTLLQYFPANNPNIEIQIWEGLLDKLTHFSIDLNNIALTHKGYTWSNDLSISIDDSNNLLITLGKYPKNYVLFSDTLPSNLFNFEDIMLFAYNRLVNEFCDFIAGFTDDFTDIYKDSMEQDNYIDSITELNNEIKLRADIYSESLTKFNNVLFSLPLTPEDREKLLDVILDMKYKFCAYKSLVDSEWSRVK